jgi:hypothetical protein
MADSETPALAASGIPNGSGAAALLSAGIGACALPVFAIVADRVPAFQKWMIFYRPTGPLSGVTTSAIVVWLATWGIFEFRWRKRDVNLRLAIMASLAMLAIGVLLTFPPIADVF